MDLKTNLNSNKMKELLTVHDNHLGKIRTASGLILDLKHPNPDSIIGYDIAKGLAYTSRFGGQTTHYYSVAQHSVLVKYLAPPELHKAALAHDGSEAYIGDVVKPLKLILGKVYTDVEERFMDVIGVKYGVLRQEFEAIKEYDRLALEMEHHAFQLGHIQEFNEWWQINVGTSVTVWPPDYALKMYLTHCKYAFGDGFIGKEVEL